MRITNSKDNDLQYNMDVSSLNVGNYTKKICNLRYCKILQDFTRFYKILQDFTRFYKILQDFTRFYKILQDFTPT